MAEGEKILPVHGEGDRRPQAGGGGGPAASAARAARPPHHAAHGPPPRAGGELALPDLAATEAAGARLAELLARGDIVTLQGGLGAGKTSLARGVLAALGLAGEAPSPTFAIVQPYDPPEVRLPVLHVDLYRIEHPAELDELGLDEARRDAALIVEWPERAPGRWQDALALSLAFADGGGRVLTAAVPPAWEGRWFRT